MNEKRLRVMLVDDHEVVRAGVGALLDNTDDMTVVAEADSAATAVAQATLCEPDIVVMDVRLADGSGIEATREILANRSDTRVIMLTTFADEDALLASVLAGASGYVLKQISSGELLRAIRAVGAGRNLMDSDANQALLERLRRGKHLASDRRLAALSPQEERILALIAQGQTNRHIAEELHLAEKTVKNYVSSILSKLEVSRRSGAAAYLVRHNGSRFGPDQYQGKGV